MVRREAEILGPGPSGYVKVVLRHLTGDPFVADVPVERIPASLRMPNSRFVVVVQGRTVLRVEPAGRAWLDIQDRMRAVLNADWDPIGVARDVDDEYDSYVGELYSWLRRGATDADIAAYLSSIETEHMGLRGTAIERRLRVAPSAPRHRLSA